MTIVVDDDALEAQIEIMTATMWRPNFDRPGSEGVSARLCHALLPAFYRATAIEQARGTYNVDMVLGASVVVGNMIATLLANAALPDCESRSALLGGFMRRVAMEALPRLLTTEQTAKWVPTRQGGTG